MSLGPTQEERERNLRLYASLPPILQLIAGKPGGGIQVNPQAPGALSDNELPRDLSVGDTTRIGGVMPDPTAIEQTPNVDPDPPLPPYAAVPMVRPGPGIRPTEMGSGFPADAIRGYVNPERGTENRGGFAVPPSVEGERSSSRPSALAPPMSGMRAPDSYSDIDRRDWYRRQGNMGQELADGISERDRGDYIHGKKFDPKTGQMIDQDKGKGSAFKNFMKGLGIGFLRGGLGGAIAGGIMNTARGNMDEEFAWNTWHKPRIDQAVAQEDYRTKQDQELLYNQQRIDTLRAQEQNLLNAADVRTYNAQKPKYKYEPRNGIMFRINENDPNGRFERVEELPIVQGESKNEWEFDGRKFWLDDAEAARMAIAIADKDVARQLAILQANTEILNDYTEKADEFDNDLAGIDANIAAFQEERDVVARNHDLALVRIKQVDNQLNGLDPEVHEEKVKALRDEKKELESKRTQYGSELAALDGKIKGEQAKRKGLRKPSKPRTVTPPSQGAPPHGDPQGLFTSK